MSLSTSNLKLYLFVSLAVAFCFLGGTRPSAQTNSQSRVSHVNDFANVVDPQTKQRLENLLTNLQAKTGVQFDVATVESTGGLDIFDYSRQLAREWDIGARTTTKKSLLLVVSKNEKAAFTQFSKSVQPALPEGSLGEMAQRLRVLLSEDQFSLGLSSAVEQFITALGNKLAFKLEDLDRPAEVAATESAPVATPEASPIQTAPASLTQPIAENETAATQTTTGATRQRQVNRAPSATATTTIRKPTAKEPARATVDDAESDESEEVELTLTLPLAERAIKLKEFLEKHPKSKSRPRAFELLVSTRAALGDQQLKGGDSLGGIEQLTLAVDEAPVDVSEKLFTGVISQIPMNLYLRNERVAAFKAAENIETKFGNDPKHLLALAGFYLGIERGDEAIRIARKAIELLPNLAEAHYLLGLGFHISLRLDEAASEYKKALELDPNLITARRSLADLNRAAGKAEEALVLYREQVTAEPKDKAARSGVVISLLELGRTEEAEKELSTALQEDPRNSTLLAGVGYWFAAHNDTKRSLDLSQRAVEIEPRYTWSQIALARSLVGEKRPLDAERSIRFARQYGKFPTLDYELASVLVALGLYEEAAEALTLSFTVKDGEIETRLGGRTPAKGTSFIELLAPERRASIFQFTPADTESNARVLKALLVFGSLLASADKPEGVDERALVAAGKELAAGDDPMRAYRQLYVASRLLRLGKGLDTVHELTAAATSGVDAALEVPAVTVAVQADELREIRSRAIAQGGIPSFPAAPRNALSNILRGRIEDLTGWAYFNQDKPTEAVDHLRRAVNILPEQTPAWRSTLWHLGAALEQSGNKDEALTYYIKSYNAGNNELSKRALIEQLYVKLNGSTAGLEERIGATPTTTNAQAVPTTPTPSPESSTAVETATPAAVPTASTEPPTASLTPTSTPSPEATPSPVETTPAAPAKSEPTPVETTSPTTEPTATPSPQPRTTETPSDPGSTEKPPERAAPTSSEPTLADLPAKPKTTLKVSGKVKDVSGTPISNVVVVLISPRGSVQASTTDAEGNYSFIVSPSDKPVRLIPSKEGLTFEPVDKTLVVTNDDFKDIDFVGAAPRSP